MALIIAPRTTEVAVIGVFATRPWAQVWHMRHRAGQGFTIPPRGEEAATVLRDAYQTHLLARMGNAVSVTEFRWREIDSESAPAGSLPPNPGLGAVGAVSAGSFPGNVAGLATKVTLRPRGRRHGRVFFPGINETQVGDAGVFQPGERTAWQNALNSFLDAATVAGANDSESIYPVVLEVPPEGRAPGTHPVLSNTRRVESLRMEQVVATQRRRLRG